MSVANYKIDILKLKRKIFNLYPPDSPVRKEIERTEKFKELQQLEASLALVNHTDIQKALSITKKRFYQDCLFVAALIGLVGYCGYAAILSRHLVMSLSINGIAAICWLMILPDYLKSIRKCWKSWKDFEREKRNLGEKVASLRKSLLKKIP